jgi:hypothetical protein
MDQDIQGRPWEPHIQKIMMNPASLRARAEIRRIIAEQDRVLGDTWAYNTNTAEAQRLEGKANEKDLEQNV